MPTFYLIPYTADGIEVCGPRRLYAESENAARVAARQWLYNSPAVAQRASVYRGAELIASVDRSVSLA